MVQLSSDGYSPPPWPDGAFRGFVNPGKRLGLPFRVHAVPPRTVPFVLVFLREEVIAVRRRLWSLSIMLLTLAAGYYFANFYAAKHPGSNVAICVEITGNLARKLNPLKKTVALSEASPFDANPEIEIPDDPQPVDPLLPDQPVPVVVPNTVGGKKVVLEPSHGTIPQLMTTRSNANREVMPLCDDGKLQPKSDPAPASKRKHEVMKPKISELEFPEEQDSQLTPKLNLKELQARVYKLIKSPADGSSGKGAKPKTDTAEFRPSDAQPGEFERKPF